MTRQMSERQIAAKVLAYMRSSPGAVDNVWGIRQFWLGEPDMELSRIERALQGLADDGLMGYRDEPLMLGGRVWYALQAAR